MDKKRCKNSDLTTPQRQQKKQAVRGSPIEFSYLKHEQRDFPPLPCSCRWWLVSPLRWTTRTSMLCFDSPVEPVQSTVTLYRLHILMLFTWILSNMDIVPNSKRVLLLFLLLHHQISSLSYHTINSVLWILLDGIVATTNTQIKPTSDTTHATRWHYCVSLR